jgi:pimeloyl-ACP methyl ester carboxylesterase
VFVDAVERAMDEAGFETAHLAGNSLGGYLALQIAARGRARSVVALAPAGGWAEGDDGSTATLGFFTSMLDLVRAAAPHADAIASTPEGRRQATAHVATDGAPIPAALVAHLIRGAAGCAGAVPMIDHALRAGWSLDAERVACPEGVGHCPQLDAPLETAQLILGFTSA